MRKAFAVTIFILSFFLLDSFTIPVVNAGGAIETVYADSASVHSQAIDSTHADSTAAVPDSLKPYVLKDSTYLEQLKYKPKDSPAAKAFPTLNPFYLKTPSIVTREVKLDSTGKYVIVREMMGGKDVKVPIKMPIEEYIKQRSEADFTQNFQELINKQDVGKKKKNDLGDLLGSFTNIDIPIPANPVFSIFGPPRINLVISGGVDIRAAFRNTKTDQSTISALGNSRNEPDFAQEVQINVNGTIGDKLNILADWNTQRTFEYENQLKIKYTGYEDELVQSVEAGNVSLATNSSFVSASSALFGIKAGFQFGPLKLTAIASQKKGQIQEKTVTGGAQEIPFEKRAWEYSKDHFFIDSNYISGYEAYIKSNQLVNSNLQILENEYEVYVTHIGQDLGNSRYATAYLYLPPVTSDNYNQYDTLREVGVKSIPGVLEVGKWDKLEPGKDFKINLDAGFISFNRSLQDGQAIGIAYRIQNGPGPNDDLFYGTMAKAITNKEDSILALKLIKPLNLLSQYKDAWKLMLKNIYPLGGRKISQSGFELNIYYKASGQEDQETIGGKKLIEIFGFDEYTGDVSPGADGKFDYLKNGITIDEERGEIIFPSLKPFTEGISNAFKKFNINLPETTYVYDNLYDTNVTAAQNNTLKDRFIIKGKTTASSSNTINLGFNIVEGSVQVLLDGQPLTPNVDYTVDYIIGQIIIKNQSALVPGANMQIKFEQNDLFQLASKTLLGTRGEVKMSDKTQFGFTIMNLNQQTLSDKVRLGEEPIDNSIYGIDGQTAGEIPYLTKALDALPMYDTKTKSEFTLRGEAAYMSPDPNTKKSPIADDKGAGIAYIDDFEGTKRIIPFGISYGMWHDMSPPAFQFNVDSTFNFTKHDTVKMKSKARSYWYNVLPSNVRITEIQPEKKAARGEDFVTVLNVNYNPKDRGEYNYSDDLNSTLLFNPKNNWGGIQRLISTSAVDLVKENVNFIEIWVKVERGMIDSTNKIFIDLGTISEDIIPNSKLDIEDKERNPNGVVNKGEDTGIDGLTDQQEQTSHQSFIEANKNVFTSIVDDPAGDNFKPTNLVNFTQVNGTEKNNPVENPPGSELGLYPDGEDLNRNGNPDLSNNYFEYELNLDTTANNPLRVGGGVNGWYQYRIPVLNYKYIIGAPDLSLIESARLWFTGHDQEFEIRLFEFNLIGNQWEELKKNDSTLKVSVVNIEDNSLQGYTSPPGVIREQDRTKPGEEVLGNEQSLSLNFFNLKDGENREAIKRYTYKPLDVFSYRQMKMFVHGDNNFEQTADKATAKLFVRFGSDSLNYYEYKAPVYPGWDERNNVKIKFEDLTAIKQKRDSVNGRVENLLDPNDPYGPTYAVYGNPTLTRINFISIGVENPSTSGTPGTPITGQIWVNELRLTEVDDTPGWAYSFSTSVKLADLGSIAFTYSHTDPFFHGLEGRFGGRVTSKNWNVSTSVSIDKFFPKSWAGTSFPFSYSHSENFQTPQYLPSSDIVVEKAADARRDLVLEQTKSTAQAEQARKNILSEVQTLSITETYALPSFRINFPTNYWLVSDFINKLNYGFTYTTSTQRSPTVFLQTSWQWNARLGYAYTLSPNYYLQPFGFFEGVFLFDALKDFQFYYLPLTNFSTDVSMARSRVNQRLRIQTSDINPTRSLTSSRNMAFGWKLTEGGLLNLSGDYSLGITSTLSHLEVDQFGRQRSFQDILERMIMQDRLVNFGFDNSYTQSFNVNTKPKIPPIFNIDKYLTVSARYGVSYRWQPNLQLGDLGTSTGWGNNISLTTDISLKSFVETWFPARDASSTSTTTQTPTQTQPRGRRGSDDEVEDVPGQKPIEIDTQKQTTDTTGQEPKKPGEGMIGIARMLFKTPFLDYDKINVNFTQTNSSANGAIPGRPGFANFFGRVPFIQQSERKYGPSRAYQLGLVSTPSANITDIFIKPQFPFVGFSTDSYKQIRAKGARITDAFNQSNKLGLRTGRDLWTGARIDLTWNLGWDYSRTQTLQTDTINGRVSIVSEATGGAIERSFLTFPPTFVFSMFKSGIKDVAEKYKVLSNNTSDLRTADAKLSDAFEQGFESVPILKKIFGRYFPRANYSFRWDGLEQFSLFKNFATRVSLDHAYQSTYRESFKGSIGGGQVVESQKINYGFSPLAGVSITFKEVLKGNMSANLRYGSTVSYDLTPTSKNIVESVSNDMSATASFARSGFEIPLFGLALQNDIDISFTYSYAKTTRSTYDAKDENLSETPGEGSTRTQMEPRIKYVLSARVTASIFYRYTNIAPDEGGSRIPGSTTNEGGLDVHISIQ